MTRLTASPLARSALERNLEHDRLNARLMAVRSRAEALRQLHLGGLVSRAETKLAFSKFSECADALDQIDREIAAQLEGIRAAEQTEAANAQADLLSERGVETFDTGSVKSRDGWLWIVSRKPRRLTPDQISTGSRYSKEYGQARRDGLSSSCNDNMGGGDEDPIEARIKAQDRLDAVAGHIHAAVGDTRLVALLDAVCGRGETLRELAGGDDRRASFIEVELRLALDMAGVAFKLDTAGQALRRVARELREVA